MIGSGEVETSNGQDGGDGVGDGDGSGGKYFIGAMEDHQGPVSQAGRCSLCSISCGMASAVV